MILIMITIEMIFVTLTLMMVAIYSNLRNLHICNFEATVFSGLYAGEIYPRGKESAI